MADSVQLKNGKTLTFSEVQPSAESENVVTTKSGKKLTFSYTPTAFSDIDNSLPAGVSGPIAQPKALQEYHKAYGQAVKAAQAATLEPDYGRGNIDLNAEKTYTGLKNKYSVYTDTAKGEKIIIPSFDSNGTQLDDAGAAAQYKQTGKYYAKFQIPSAVPTAQETMNNRLAAMGLSAQTGTRQVSTLAGAGLKNMNVIMTERDAEVNRQVQAYLQELKDRDVEKKTEQIENGDMQLLTNLTFPEMAEIEKKRTQKKVQEQMNTAFGDADSSFLSGLGLATVSGLQNYQSGVQGVANGGRTDVLSGAIDSAIKAVAARERMQMDSVEGAVFDLVQNLVQNAPSMALGMSGSSFIGSASVFASSYGNDLKYAKAAGYDARKAHTYAFLDGLNQAFLDKLGSMPGVGGVTNTVAENLTKNVSNAFLRFVSKIAIDAAGEGIEEMVQTAVENGLKNAVLGEKNNASLISEEALYSAFLGALSGGLINTVTMGVSSIGNKNNEISPEVREAVREMLVNHTVETAVRYDVKEDVYRDIAQVSGEIGVPIRFAANEDMAVTNAQGGVSYAEGRYDYNPETGTGTVVLNQNITAERANHFLLKHELTHAIEGTKEWDSIVQHIRNEMGEASFEEAKQNKAQEYASKGIELDDGGALREVVADWVGNNLYSGGFVTAIFNSNTEAGSAMQRAFTRLRSAFSKQKNSRPVSRTGEMERLFRKGVDRRAVWNNSGVIEGGGTGTDSAYSLEALPDGTPYVEVNVDQDIFDGLTPDEMRVKAVKEIKRRFVGKVIGETGRAYMQGKLAKEYGYPARFLKESNLIEAKMRASTELDNIVDAGTDFRNEPDGMYGHTHPEATGGFDKYNAIFRVKERFYFGEVNIMVTNRGRVFKDLTKIKDITDDITTQYGEIPQGGFANDISDTRVSQNSFGVNSYDMQNGGENSQFSFGGVNGTDINVPYEGELDTESPSRGQAAPAPFRQGGLDGREAQTRGVEGAAPYDEGTVKTANSQALGNLEANNPSVAADTATPPLTQGRQLETAEVEVQGQEIPEGTTGATETVYREERITPDAVRREAAARAGTAVQEKTVAQGRTVEELEQELTDRELFNRAYMAAQIDRPDSTVEIDGKQISSDAYMDAVEDMLPDTVEGVEQYIQEISRQQGEEMARAFDETGEVGETTLPVELEMLAAQRKVERMRLAAGETDGKVWRRFYEQRLKGLDANQTHAAEAVEYLAGRDERYSPISNAKTLEKAQMRLKDPAYVERLGRRIKRYKPGDMFNDVDAAAAQVMINDAKNNGDLELYSDLVVGLSRKGTELGRAVQILSMQAKLTPEGTIRAAQRTMQKAVDGQYGEGTSDSIDQVSGTIVDAVERAAVNLEGATVGELETALGDAITAQNSPYITEKQIRDIVHTAVDKATNIPQQLKRMLQKDDVQKTLAEKILYIHSQGHLTDAKLSGVVKEALGLPDITTEDMGQLIALVETMQETEEGTLERQAATEEIYRFLGEKLPVTKLEALMGWRKFAMLANPKTHFRNIVSNFVMQKGVNKVDAAISTALQKWIIADPSKRTAFVGWRGTDFGKQLMADGALEKSAERALVRLRGSEKYEMTNSKLAQYKKEFEALFGKKLGAALDRLSGWNSNALEAEDAWAFKPAFIDALGQIMTVRNTTEITEEIFETAYDKAAETVFRADNAMATVLSQMKQGMFDMSTAKGKKALGFIADIVIPFSKTPANIAVSSFQHSPLGLVKSGYDLVMQMRGKSNKQMADIINGLSKGITGTLLMGIGLLLGSFGLFNTGYGKTEKERAADELAGIQQNALVIGNVSFTLDWLQPSASPLIVGASIAQRLREDGLSLSAIGGAVMDGTDSLFELTMLQSLYDVLGGYDAGASASAASIAENVVSQSIPTLLGQAARAIDPVQRKTTGDNDFATVINQIMAKVPGLTYLLEPELDVWGNEVYRTGKASAGNAFLNAVQQFILPFNYKQGTGADDHLSQAVLDMYNSGADKSSRALPTSVTRDDAREMGVDYDELFRIVAQMQREKVEELMNDKVSYSVQTAGANGKKRTVQKRWSQMTEDEQLRVMNRVYSDVKSTATDPDEAFYDEIIGRLRYGN